MERRLQSLLDVAEEDKSDGMPHLPTDFAGFKDLDRIGYVVSKELVFFVLFGFLLFLLLFKLYN